MFDNVTKSGAGVGRDVEDFGRALIDSAIQKPANAAMELKDWAFNTHTPKLELVEPPKENTFGAQLGNFAGQAMHIYLLGKTFNAGSGITGVGVGENALRYGVAGFSYGTFFQSTADQPGNFLLNRAANGVVQGGTWAIIGGTASTLTQFGILSKPMFRNSFGHTVNSAVSGGTGGFVNAELDAVVNHRRLATASEINRSVVHYAVTGSLAGPLAKGSQNVRPMENLMIGK